MKSYKEFAEEAEYLEENLGRAVKNLFRRKKKVDIPSGAGRKQRRPRIKETKVALGFLKLQELLVQQALLQLE